MVGVTDGVPVPVPKIVPELIVNTPLPAPKELLTLLERRPIEDKTTGVHKRATSELLSSIFQFRRKQGL